MQETAFWGGMGFFSFLWLILALHIISLIDKRVEIPAAIDKVFKCLVEELYFFCVVLAFAVDAIAFGFLGGIVILAIQVMIATAVGVAILWLGIICLQVESATAKLKELAKIFWKKQFRLL